MSVGLHIKTPNFSWLLCGYLHNNMVKVKSFPLNVLNLSPNLLKKTSNLRMLAYFSAQSSRSFANLSNTPVNGSHISTSSLMTSAKNYGDQPSDSTGASSI